MILLEIWFLGIILMIMYKELNKKIALITGASRGFGASIAKRLAKEGCFVILNYRRSRSEAEAVLQAIHNDGGEGIAIKADIGNEEKLYAMFEAIKQEIGKLDIVIANASFGIPGTLMDTKVRHWDATLDANALSLLLMAQQAVPLMKDWGRIISITSYGGQRVLPGYGVVGAAKSTVEGLTRSLAFELAPKGIVVNGVMPGVSDTKSMRAIEGYQDVLDYAKERSATQSLVTPEHVSNVVAFLCSDQAEMICGQCLVVDGGTFIRG